MRCALAALFALALSFAAAPAAPVPKHLMPKDEPLFFPTKVGTKHVSEWQGKDYVCVIAKVEKTDDGFEVTEEREVSEGGRTHEQTVVVSTKGLLITSYYGTPVTPPIWVLKLPHVENNTWTDKYGGQERTHTSMGWEEIEVPAGKMRAMRVDRTDGGAVTSYWYAPGMGCIKWSCGMLKREWKSFDK